LNVGLHALDLEGQLGEGLVDELDGSFWSQRG
jgi:hypothetical protein